MDGWMDGWMDGHCVVQDGALERFVWRGMGSLFLVGFVVNSWRRGTVCTVHIIIFISD
jgi:hypothetical protein